MIMNYEQQNNGEEVKGERNCFVVDRVTRFGKIRIFANASNDIDAHTNRY